MGIRKNDCDEGMGEGAVHYCEGHWKWAASHMCCFSSGSFIRGSHVCIVPMFLNTPAFQAFYCVCVCVCVCV
jgi:hypothetical protein